MLLQMSSPLTKNRCLSLQMGTDTC